MRLLPNREPASTKPGNEILAKCCYHILRGESFPPGDFEAHRGENETEKDEEEEEASNDLHDASCHG